MSLQMFNLLMDGGMILKEFAYGSHYIIVQYAIKCEDNIPLLLVNFVFT